MGVRGTESSSGDGFDEIAATRGGCRDKYVALRGRHISRVSKYQGDFSAHLTGQHCCARVAGGSLASRQSERGEKPKEGGDQGMSLILLKLTTENQ